MKEIAGKVAVVLAGGDGIGRSMALALAEAGADVVIGDIRADAAQSVSREVIGRGRRSLAMQTDVSKLEHVEQIADAAYKEFGRVDILCNNAGIVLRPNRAIWDTSYADLKYIVDVNIWGLLNGVHVFVPRMRQQSGEKHIVNTSSVGALIRAPGMTMYLMTKAAVDMFSQNIREELRADGFGVTTLFPGVINTKAVENNRLVRSAEGQAADAAVKPYASYAEERGEKMTQVAGGRGAIQIIGAGELTVPIEPALVGPLVVAAIRANRPVCMTHPPPAEGIQMRVDDLLNGYHPHD